MSRPVSSATACAKASAKPFLALRPVPTAVPPCARSSSRGSDAFTRSMLNRNCTAAASAQPQAFPAWAASGDFPEERQRSTTAWLQIAVHLRSIYSSSAPPPPLSCFSPSCVEPILAT